MRTLTWLPFEVSALKSTCSLCLERSIGIRVQRRAILAPRTLGWSHTLSGSFGIWSSWWCIERVAFHLHHTSDWGSEIGAFKYSSSLSADLLLGSWCPLNRLCIQFCLFSGPFGCKSTLLWWKLVESLEVVTVPEIELEVLGRMFDVDEVIHKVACCTWLGGVWSA